MTLEGKFFYIKRDSTGGGRPLDPAGDNNSIDEKGKHKKGGVRGAQNQHRNKHDKNEEKPIRPKIDVEVETPNFFWLQD